MYPLGWYELYVEASYLCYFASTVTSREALREKLRKLYAKHGEKLRKLFQPRVLFAGTFTRTKSASANSISPNKRDTYYVRDRLIKSFA